MKRLIYITLVSCLLSLVCLGQSRTNRLTRPCPGSTTPATVSISVAGNIVLTPCSGGTVTLTGATTAGDFSAGTAGDAKITVDVGAVANRVLIDGGEGKVILGDVTSVGNATTLTVDNATAEIAITGGDLRATGSIFSSGANAGIGYVTGAGGAVTQTGTRTTGVQIDRPSMAITLVSAAGSATPASFTVTNATVAATDVVRCSQKSGTDLYQILTTATSAGSFRITFFTTGGTTTEQPVFNCVVLKAVAA